MALVLLNAITDLGDSALMLPLAVTLAVVLWSQQSASAALAWIGALIPGLAAITALKLAGHACEKALAIPTLVSPSGHAAFAAMVYGAAAVIVARHTAGAARWLAGLAATGLVATVAASRLLLDAHSAVEVVIGLTVGGATVTLFALLYRRLPPATVRSRGAAAAAGLAVLLIVALHGERLHAESLIRTLAVELRTQVGVCRTSGLRVDSNDALALAGVSL
ncbi:phosphatase PAP2 family protein [Azospirillum sp. sgz301742]